GRAGYIRLPTELAFHTHVTRNAGNLVSKSRQGDGHVVDGRDERGYLAPRVERQTLLQIAVRHRGHDAGNTAHLARQILRHDVHVVGQLAPSARNVLDLRLATQLPFGTHLAGYARHLGGEGAQLIDHRVDGGLELEELTPHFNRDLAR